MSPIANYLIKELNWYEGLAKAIDYAGGKCVYCDEDLLSTRLGYSSIVMDHLLPKSIYKNLEWETDNHVLSCSSCNGMKGNWNPLNSEVLSIELLRADKQQIINKVRNMLAKKIIERDLEWKTIRAKITS